MYVPPVFAEQHLDTLHDAMRHHPLGTLVTMADGFAANHVPFVLHSDEGTHGCGLLRAHLARGNEQARVGRGTVPDGGVPDGVVPNGTVEALVIFLGVDHYVTPSWYETKRRTGKVVPTWNYVAVHAWGRMRVVDDPAWVRAQVESLTTLHEGGRPAPWRVTDAPPDFTASQLKGIVGIEIDVVRLQGKWKLSQNRTPEDRTGVVTGLGDEADAAGPAMARLMAGS